jgi:exo-beta-1,3-glucanase (GH17 family)/cellulose synthase/poly-beta-1,6-N-acetylglucosamine synthase-like glycosyltransferase
MTGAHPRLLVRWPGALAVCALMLGLNFALWRAANPPLSAPEAPPTVAGLAYNAFQRWESPLTQRFPTDAEIDADLAHMRRLTARLRTYSAAEFPALPALAHQHGIELALGVWLDRRLDNNEREVAAALEAARRHPSVKRLVVGNETQLHRQLSPQELYDVLDRIRAAQPGVPVTTAEPWHIWLAQPELAEHVDFIMVHLLPYWEGVPVEAALDEALLRYAQVQARFPDRRVVIGEIGWPSGGKAVGVALATPLAQARFVREFLARTAGSTLDYYLMEATDQPWKRATEGAVGAHWGVLEASRTPKFTHDGPVQADPYWHGKALAAGLLGLAAMLPFLLAFAHLRLPARLLFAASAQAIASFAVLIGTLPLVHYLRPLDWALLVVLLPALALLGAILMTLLFEFVELFWDGQLRHRAPARPLAPGARAPCVSVHLACCNEPAAQVIAAIDSLLALDWPDLEVIVVDNNTTDAALWQPVQAHVAARAAELTGNERLRLKFFHLPCWPGYKAGALNVALRETDPRAEWVALVDADYVVRPDWLRQVAGYFAEAAVGLVQTPQAHRDWAGAPLARMMNWEYEGFFRLGMHHRHERDAIVQHGTMTAIRAPLLRALGGWAEDCVCEDSELGLRVLASGQRALYVDEVLGRGLVPADFAAYRRQRRRWAQGAMQILRRHAAALLGRSGLTWAQRYHFAAGWLPWVGDMLHLVFSIAAILWSLGVLLAPAYFSLPIALFVAPLAVFVLARLLLGPLLYARRVTRSAADIAGAALAGMGLSHAIARGMLAGLARRRAVFEVTRKATSTPAPPAARERLGGVAEEAVLLVLLAACALAFALLYPADEADARRWILLLALQALPYAAALACALLSRWPQPAQQAVDLGELSAAPAQAGTQDR